VKKVIAIIGARPQFIKHFAFESSIDRRFQLITIHTGQHYDENMSQVFFDQLGMKKPDYILKLGGGNHGAQTAAMMESIEKIVLDVLPDMMVLYGDTNSTLAGALVAAKLHVPVAHIEAGLRSYNKSMPEEINRVLTDHVSDLLFVPSDVAKSNLANEGIFKNIHIVGDIMKDLVITSTQNHWIKKPKDTDKPYIYATLHRPYNTDEKTRLEYVLSALQSIPLHVVFAIHPRTKNAMKNYGLLEASYPNITFIAPQGYFENLGYLYHSQGLITDSGGMQKEAYWLQKKCITIRTETEWVETLIDHDNVLMFEDLTLLADEITKPATCSDKNLYGNGKSAQEMIRLISTALER